MTLPASKSVPMPKPGARTPERIGKYVVIREVGRGSTGIVYLSHDAYYGRDVAIKLYNMDTGGDEERARIARKMFLSEAHLVGMLQHPHILPIYDAGEENGHCYIVTEHVHGARTLAAYCRPDNLLRIDDTVEIMFKCAKALHYAHSRGVIHRDIKPSNIMLTQDSDVRIIDFGIALVGGDTTRGPLCITVQLLGYLPSGAALNRGGARAGDVLFVSGTCGDAAAGLAIEQRRLTGPAEARNWLRERFLWPTPRVALGEQLRRFASACIDVSDGLLADAGKLASASHLGAELAWSDVPLSEPLTTLLGERRARELALTGGDDYELCFAVPADNIARLFAQLPAQQWHYTRIGALRAAPGTVVVRDGSVMEFSHSGYEHFV